MLAGSITLEDVRIVFEATENLTVKVDVYEYDPSANGIETASFKHESMEVPQDKFFKALAIAVHNDGMPNWEADYPDAESIMGKIRWIP